MRENVPIKQIYVTGNSAIDALHWASRLDVPFVEPGGAGDVRQRPAPRARDGAPPRELGRRPAAASARPSRGSPTAHPDVAFVLPLHPNPRVRSTLRPLLDALANVLLCEPVSYGEFARLLARCDLVITDSGGIQEEAPALGKPVLVTREITERVEGVDAGTLALVGTDPDRIVAVADAPADRPGRLRGDGRGAEPLRRRPRGRAGSSPRSSTCTPAARPRRPFGSSLDRRAVLAATGAVEADVAELPAARRRCRSRLPVRGPP